MVIINTVKNMFWGVTVDAGKRYSQVVNQTFHLSMAALESGTGTSNECVQLMIQHNSSEFLLCSLQQGKLLQQPLDLIFAAGEELSFSLVGKGVVHLTGYLLDDQGDDYGDFSDEEESDSDAPQLIEVDADAIKAGSKRKALESPADAKKKKFSEAFEEDDDDDDEDDEDYSEDDLTFDEDEDSDLDDEDEDDFDEEEDEEEVPPQLKHKAQKTPVMSPKELKNKAQKTPVMTPKGDNMGSAKKDKAKAKVEKTPQSTPAKADAKTPISQKKGNNQKQNEKAPETPSTPVNGESAKKKKKKKKKNKDGESSMNESTTSSPEKSSAESTPKSASKGKKEGTPKIETPGKRKVVPGGTVVEDLKVGHGPEAKPGKMVSVYYVGTLSKTSKQFDSCSSGKPFRFRLKQGEVIKGWDNGVEGMKVGGKRKITVPANQAYGSQRQGPIPPNSALTFEVELKAVS